MSQFTVFPSPTPNLVKRVEYIQNDSKCEETWSVLSCFLCADYVSVFTMILHHAWNNEKTLTFEQKIDVRLEIASFFSCFLRADKNVDIYSASAPYTKHRENTCTLAQNSVLLYKSLVFSRVFFALIIRRYLPCSRALRKTSRKQLHFCQISMFFHIPGNLRCLMSFDGRRKRMHFYVGSRNYFYRRKNTQKHYSLCG